jgi:hypothetical protein
MATVLAGQSSSSDVAQAHKCLSPLLSPPDGPEAFYGRRYENLGASDRLSAIADIATSDLEGLPLRDSLGGDMDTVLGTITPQWIEDQVESAILQSTPERVMSELAIRGVAHDLIFTPPTPVAELRVPALTLRPLIDAVDADARRLAYDPAQQELRAQALFAADHDGQAFNRAVALRIADEAGEHGRLVRRMDLDLKARRRLEDLDREHRRRRRYAKAFALAVRDLSAAGRPVSIPQLVRAFDAIAGLDKIPFRRGPSEHLTAELLASMAREFYHALDDPERVVTFLLLTFPIKNSSGLRTNVATEAADFGDLLMLAQLRRLLQFLKELGWPNVRFVCLADGIVYGKYLGPYPRALPVFYRGNVSFGTRWVSADAS